MSVRPGRLWALLSILPLAGCMQEWAVSMNPPDEFLALCEEHLGLEIYKTADNVEGIIYPYEAGCDGACKATLRDRRYKFVEAKASGESLTGLTPGRGTYRFTLEPIGHPNCRLFEQWHAGKFPQTAAKAQHIKVYEGVCIATWPIEHLTASYEKQNLEIITRDRWYGKLRTAVQRVVDRRDGTVMAERQRHWIDTPNLPGGMYCPEWSGERANWSIYDVLKPAERQ